MMRQPWTESELTILRELHARPKPWGRRIGEEFRSRSPYPERSNKAIEVACSRLGHPRQIEPPRPGRDVLAGRLATARQEAQAARGEVEAAQAALGRLASSWSPTRISRLGTEPGSVELREHDRIAPTPELARAWADRQAEQDRTSGCLAQLTVTDEHGRDLGSWVVCNHAARWIEDAEAGRLCFDVLAFRAGCTLDLAGEQRPFRLSDPLAWVPAGVPAQRTQLPQEARKEPEPVQGAPWG